MLLNENLAWLQDFNTLNAKLLLHAYSCVAVSAWLVAKQCFQLRLLAGCGAVLAKERKNSCAIGRHGGNLCARKQSGEAVYL